MQQTLQIANLRVPEWKIMQAVTFWCVKQDSQDSQLLIKESNKLHGVDKRRNYFRASCELLAQQRYLKPQHSIRHQKSIINGACKVRGCCITCELLYRSQQLTNTLISRISQHNLLKQQDNRLYLSIRPCTQTMVTPRNNLLFTEQTFWAVSNFNTLDSMETNLCMPGNKSEA